MADEATMPDIDAAIGDIVRHRPVRRPVVEMRPPGTPMPPAAEAGNPFVALEQAHGALVALHEHMITLATKLTGEPPPFEPSKHEPGGGLLGLSCMTARGMTERIQHMEMLALRFDDRLT